jgi:hypothetical protein
MAPLPEGAQAQAGAEAPVQVHGYQQVLEMLKIADPEFRESLLRRLGARDMELALSLRQALRKL